MALSLKVRDNRWQFSFGSKYMVIADVVTDVATPYVAGGVAISLSIDPQVKASRAPWFSTYSSNLGYTAAYVPSDAATALPNPPSTTLANSNQGKLMIFLGGVEVTGSLTLVPGNLQGLFIFQGME